MSGMRSMTAVRSTVAMLGRSQNRALMRGGRG